jgi:hypothetical protein
MNRAKKYNFADLIGIVSASICLVHCIATPLLIVFGAAFITNPAFKYLFLIISFASIFKATENVTSTKITVLFWVAFWGFLLSILFQEEYEWLHYTSYLFTILIIVGHILNMKHCNECSKQNDNEN